MVVVRPAWPGRAAATAPAADPCPETAGNAQAPAAAVQFAPKPSAAAERLRDLERLAKEAAHEQFAEFQQALLRLHQSADEIRSGGELFPVGIREICRMVAEQTDAWAKTSDILNRRGLGR